MNSKVLLVGSVLLLAGWTASAARAAGDEQENCCEFEDGSCISSPEMTQEFCEAEAQEGVFYGGWVCIEEGGCQPPAAPGEELAECPASFFPLAFIPVSLFIARRRRRTAR